MEPTTDTHDLRFMLFESANRLWRRQTCSGSLYVRDKVSPLKAASLEKHCRNIKWIKDDSTFLDMIENKKRKEVRKPTNENVKPENPRPANPSCLTHRWGKKINPLLLFYFSLKCQFTVLHLNFCHLLLNSMQIVGHLLVHFIVLRSTTLSATCLRAVRPGRENLALQFVLKQQHQQQKSFPSVNLKHGYAD